MPGAPLFVPMFASAGVLSSSCEKQSPCQEQEALLANIFNEGYLISIMCMMPIGLLFDYRGGQFCGVVGASGVAVASTLLGIVLRLRLDMLSP